MKNKNKILSLVMVVFLFVISAFAWFKPADDFSESERRKLNQFPDLSFKTVLRLISMFTFLRSLWTLL